MTEFIPAHRACIHWDRPRNGFPGAVVVSDAQEPRFIRLQCSAGAMTDSWMAGDHPLDTPEGVFGLHFIAAPAPNYAWIREALRQFGKIDRCDWARQMLAAIERAEAADDAR